jgi:hypothetical protein
LQVTIHHIAAGLLEEVEEAEYLKVINKETQTQDTGTGTDQKEKHHRRCNNDSRRTTPKTDRIIETTDR